MTSELLGCVGAGAGCTGWGGDLVKSVVGARELPFRRSPFTGDAPASEVVRKEHRP